MTKLAKTVALFLALSALAGCGGGGDTAPTKAVFIKQAEAICAKADKSQLTVYSRYTKKHPFGKLSLEQQLKIVVTLGLPPIEEEADELAALTPPAGDGERIEAIVSGIEDALKKAKENPKSMGSSATSPFNKVDAMAESYGFKECSDTS